MIVPDNGMLDHQALRAMVNDINEKELSAWEVLTGEVYYYDRKTKELSIAGVKKERETEKEGGSIADKLLRKQEQVHRESGSRSFMIPEMVM